MITITNKNIQKLFYHLLKELGKQYWWPGDTKFEISIGAILTQNTNWGNVEKALSNLKKSNINSFHDIVSYDEQQLAQLIRPSGYYNQKAKKLRIFSQFMIDEFNGKFNTDLSTNILREKLLSLYGIGNETADSIILYAFEKPIFVIDTYTKRILSRHNFVDFDIKYDELAKKIVANINNDLYIYNEFHALIVNIGKNFCKNRNPDCDNCPINRFRE